jgi:SAM-dependent MidA family methyltransferase
LATAAEPERLDAFMARANAAYYANRDPFADFATAPELSQVFGELLGLWAAETWRAMGAPDPAILAEAGPGRGTLIADALRAVGRAAPGFATALRLHLVETSPRLRALAAERLPSVTWHDTVAALPPGPMILLGNEFLDALPIRQIVRRGDGWTERFVAEGQFVEVPFEQNPFSAPGGGEGFVAEGTIHEISEPARTIVSALARRVVAQGGAALFLDYGPPESGPGDTLQAIRAGRPCHPLDEAGQADLTAQVDFAALADLARAEGAVVWGPIPQGVFLVRLGLFQRTGQVARANPQLAVALMAAAQRLAEPAAMGRLFKAFGFGHPSLPPPPGFTA